MKELILTVIVLTVLAGCGGIETPKPAIQPPATPTVPVAGGVACDYYCQAVQAGRAPGPHYPPVPVN